VVGEPEPESRPVAAAAVVVPSPDESVDGLVPVVPPVVVVALLGDVVVLRGVVVDGFAPGLLTDELAAEPGVEPTELLELLGLLGRAGVVLGGFGLGLDGLLDEEDGLGLGAGLGAAAGGALLGAPPEPKANPMTLPAGGL
jgi:hypothetical protein